MSFAEFSPGIGESAPTVARSQGGLLLFAYQSVPPAPGRESGVSQPSTPATPAAPAGGSSAPGGALSGILPMLLMVPLILLLVFSSRSQQKKQAATIAGLKKGDRVLTEGGIVGRLVEIGERYAKLEIAPGVKIEVLKARLAGADTADPQPTAAAAAEKK